MPFTISHAAAVLPFARPLARWRLLSATVIGSMVPDFGFLMPWRPPRIETHSALSLLTFCLPVGLLAFWVFQLLLKGPVMAVLPNAAYQRWRRFAGPAPLGSVKQWVLAAGGVLVGATSHLVWDAFTHEGARGIRMIPILDDPTVDFGGHHLAGARLLQDGSSLFGLIMVLLFVAYALRRGGLAALTGRPLSFAERSAWLAGYGLAAMVLAAFFLSLRHPSAADGRALGVWAGYVAIAALRGFAAAVLIVSLCLHLRLRANR
jgi:Domain of unknown function (DUF4184)